MAYVIKEWYVNESPNANGEYVHIKGREGGLISFLLSLIGIDPTVSLIVDKSNVRFEEGSWSGSLMRVTPIDRICTGGYGYEKPWKIAVVIGVLGSFTFVLAPLFWVGAVVYYLLNKEMSIAINDLGGRVAGIAFKRSVIEGIKVDEIEAARVIRIVVSLVNGNQPMPQEALTRAAPASAPPGPPVTTSGGGNAANICPKCSTSVTLADAFCGSCGYKLR